MKSSLALLGTILSVASLAAPAHADIPCYEATYIVNMRADPDSSAAEIGQIVTGEKGRLQELSEDRRWAKLKVPSSKFVRERVGWVLFEDQQGPLLVACKK